MCWPILKSQQFWWKYFIGLTLKTCQKYFKNFYAAPFSPQFVISQSHFISARCRELHCRAFALLRSTRRPLLLIKPQLASHTHTDTIRRKGLHFQVKNGLAGTQLISGGHWRDYGYEKQSSQPTETLPSMGDKRAELGVTLWSHGPRAPLP